MKACRCFIPKDFGEVKNLQVHIFRDGSRVGYGAVAYLRLENIDECIHCAFVLGRARLAPIREITIPRLELSAAVVAVELRRVIEEELEYIVNSVTFWTDSISVLKCIENETKRFHTFESNRLTAIRNGSDVSEWRYVEGERNPADDASKGLKMNDMLANKRWLEGPEFLWKSKDCWPAAVSVSGTVTGGLCVEELKKAEMDIVRYVQSMAFPKLTKLEDISYPSNERTRKKILKKAKTSLYQLNPLMEDDVLVVGGRLENAQINEEAKHPVILPY